jgi:4-amino-4-deoxy-L-arabinose transferase-like glycosyltransferase
MKNKIAKPYFLLIFILLIAGIFRLYNLGTVPPSPDWDEAALGYNALSILKTGKDEFGVKFPLILRSFDDYKPALYAYCVIPFIKVFGLSTFSVRLPSAVFGILTVWGTYLLVMELFKVLQVKPLTSTKLALLSAFLVAVSSWHIQFSRIAFEANTGVFLNVFGLYFFFKGLSKFKYLLLSAVFLGLTPYVYQSEKVLLPLFIILLFILFNNELLKFSWKLVFPSFLGFCIIFPFYYQTIVTPNALLRAKGVSIFADQTNFLSKTADRLNYDTQINNPFGKVFDNRRVTYGKTILANYLTHFDLNWLFVVGDEPRHQPPEFGHLYLIELPFLLLGIYGLAFSKLKRNIKMFLLLWALIVPIPSSITTGVPHSIRTLHFIPLFQIVTAYGILFTYYECKKRMKPIFFTVCLCIFGLFATINFLQYMDSYFVQYNHRDSEFWQYGYQEAVDYIKSVENSYKTIVVSNKPPLDQSYMFFLYFLQYDPEKYLEEGGTKSGGFAEDNSFSKYVFRPINWAEEDKDDVLFVGRSGDIPESAKVLKTIHYLNGKPAMVIAEN